ncbi:hypothetical protein PENTCL1PPCAC_4528, partial [Pristionchus entomophagus]
HCASHSGCQHTSIVDGVGLVVIRDLYFFNRQLRLDHRFDHRRHDFRVRAHLCCGRVVRLAHEEQGSGTSR